MLYLACTIISSVDLAHYGVFRANFVLKIGYLWIVVQQYGMINVFRPFRKKVLITFL